MTTEWAVSIPLEHVDAAAPMRVVAEIEACAADNRLWLRGTDWNESLDCSLRKILGAERFHILAEGQTARWGCMLASGRLPEGPWKLFSEWLQPVSPPTVLPAKIGQRATLQIVRSADERAANLIEVDFDVWREYAISASQLRLGRLSFAVSDDSRALIRGDPLPPLPGSRYVEHHGVAVPIGWTWSPVVNAQVVRQALGLAEGDVALLAVAGECEIISADNFVRATRSAVRLTEQGIGRDLR